MKDETRSDAQKSHRIPQAGEEVKMQRPLGRKELGIQDSGGKVLLQHRVGGRRKLVWGRVR